MRLRSALRQLAGDLGLDGDELIAYAREDKDGEGDLTAGGLLEQSLRAKVESYTPLCGPCSP